VTDEQKAPAREPVAFLRQQADAGARAVVRLPRAILSRASRPTASASICRWSCPTGRWCGIWWWWGRGSSGPS